MISKIDYPKKNISFDKQITLFQERGLIIDNIEIVKGFLRNINYFRLQGFWWKFQIDKTNHKFKEGTTFEKTIKLHTFNQKFQKSIV